MNAVKGIGLVLWLFLAVHDHVFGFQGPACEGGNVIKGVNQWSDSSLRCCTSEECFGYDVNSVAKQVTKSLKARLHSSLPMKRGKLTRSGLGSSFVLHNSEDHGPEASCCTSKTSVIYPLSGYSAVTGQRVTVLQIGPFRQPVIYEKCSERPCRFLRGNCTQVYTPLPLYVMGNASDGRLGAELDYVLVESGCRCTQREMLDDNDRSGVRMGVDRTVKDALRVITGFDLSPDQLIDPFVHQGLQESITSTTSFPLMSNLSTLGTNKPGVTTMKPIVEAQSTRTSFKPATLSTKKPVVAKTTSTLTTQSSVRTTETTITERPSTTAETIRWTLPTRATVPSTTSQVTTAAPSTRQPTTPQVTTTLLPVPSLPPPGQPLEIKPGYFNPVNLLLKPYLSKV